MDSTVDSGRLPVEGRLPRLDGATGWLNSPPLTSVSLRGKVVAVDFCTYTCINWLRTLPYVRAWSEKYSDQSLVVLGIHTPEFSVERDSEHVRQALSRLRVEYPIALDNDYGVWNAFSNRYWPALYLVDAEGRIRHHWFGEGDYERSERFIQRLLGDAGAERIDADLVSVKGEGPEAAADWDELQSPETYLGHERTESFRSPGGIAPDRHHVYALPDALGLNEWALEGDWTMQVEGAVSNDVGGRIAFRFHARDVHLVMGPVDGGPSIPFRVSIDGRPPSDGSGGDVDADGAGTLVEPRMYQLIRQRGQIGSRLFEIEFHGAGAQAFVFTFG